MADSGNDHHFPCVAMINPGCYYTEVWRLNRLLVLDERLFYFGQRKGQGRRLRQFVHPPINPLIEINEWNQTRSKISWQRSENVDL